MDGLELGPGFGLGGLDEGSDLGWGRVPVIRPVWGSSAPPISPENPHLGPQYGIVLAGGGVDDAVGHGELQFKAGGRGHQGQRLVQRQYPASFHGRYRLHRHLFATLPQHGFVDFVQGDAGHQQTIQFHQWGGEMRGIGTIREILQPSG